MRIIATICILLLMAGAFFFGTSINKEKESPYDVTEVVSGSMEHEMEGANNGGASDFESKTGAGESGDMGYANIAAAFSNQEEATIELFERSAPSVVFITTTSLRQNSWSTDIYEIPQGSGTGFMWDEDGHIVTNFHVIEGGNRFTITLADQTSYEASVVGTEASKDLAVLRIIAPNINLKPLPVGRSSNLRVGQSVFAIGNPFGLDQSLTTGIISALGREIKAKNGRPIKDVIQTDAAINPGNSGGPLLDSSGRLIGVNTAIYSPSGASAGIGFSIPVDVVRWVVPDIIKFGEVRRPILGVELVPEQYYDGEGSMLRAVGEDTPAGLAGLRGVRRTNSGSVIAGDVIVQINEFKIDSNNDLILALEKFKVGDEINVQFKRDKELDSVSLNLASSIRK